MSSFSELHSEFKEEISLMKDGVVFVQSSYKAIGLLKEARTKTASSLPAEIATPLDSIPAPNRKAENMTHDGMIVLLAATYEVFARDTIEAICREIENQIPKFDDLDESIKSENARATGRILSRRSEQKYSQFDYVDLCKKIGTCVSGSAQYSLNSGPLAAHDRNLNVGELSGLFKRVGIENLLDKIGASASIQQYFGTTEAASAKKAVCAKLTEFISLRNQVAHNGRGDSSVAPEAIMQWADYFIALAEALSLIAEQYCAALLPTGQVQSSAVNVPTTNTP
jgi:hypothetical protein